jgi:hypothetical protein
MMKVKKKTSSYSSHMGEKDRTERDLMQCIYKISWLTEEQTGVEFEWEQGLFLIFYILGIMGSC